MWNIFFSKIIMWNIFNRMHMYIIYTTFPLNYGKKNLRLRTYDLIDSASYKQSHGSFHSTQKAFLFYFLYDLQKKFTYYCPQDLNSCKSYTSNESTIVFKVFSADDHCFSLALATNRTTEFPSAVVFARL
jgi:hypothetical protein